MIIAELLLLDEDEDEVRMTGDELEEEFEFVVEIVGGICGAKVKGSPRRKI